jgi:hypothetical protein
VIPRRGNDTAAADGGAVDFRGMRLSRRALAAAVLSALAACGGDGAATGPSSTLPPRPYVMGFSAIPPRLDPALIPPVVDLWARRADAGLVLQDPPWAELLAGVDAETLVRANPLGVATYFRGKGLRIIASIDPGNGLDRAHESAALVAAGRSLAEPAVQELYRRYVGAFVTLVRPEAVTLASETNLIRALSPPPVYAGLAAAANLAAAEARQRDPSLRLMITVQVEVASGRLPGGVGAGIAQDRADFPFLQALGLSSFPYLAGFNDPEEIPLDYYSRLAAGAPVPLYVIEGGWPSTSALGSSPDEQRRFVERHARLLDTAGAAAWFQLTFTDLDVAAFGPGIAPFAFLGLVDTALQPKPALQAWDAEFARPRRP